jgi:phosphoglycolate phosphatase-like HAD superfamily hydrolase
VGRFRVIVLDFDGTVVESVGIKDRVFYELFRGFPDKLDRIMAYHLSHNAVIRFEKFEHIYTKILGLPYTEEVKEHLSERFSALAFNAIVECPYVEGAWDFLARYQKLVPLYLVSMSPEDELNRILAARGLSQFFKKVYPSSWQKCEALRDIVEREGITPGEAVFIGDAIEDYYAADEAGVFFIGRNSGKPFEGAPIPLFADFSGVRGFIEG